MANNPITGAGYLLRGLGLIFKPGIRKYTLIPLLINTILFASIIWFGAQQFEELINWMLSYLPGWLDWLRFILWPLFAITAVLVVFFSFSMVANLIGAPFNGLLSEAVDRHLSGQAIEQEGDWKILLKNIVPALIDELRKILYFLIRAIPLGILFLIPVINIVAPFLWLAFSAWMLAVEYCDYPMGNHGLSFQDQRVRLKQKRMLSLGFGSSTLLATMIPIANFLVMPAAVAGSTAMWVDKFADIND
jgi:CysZ protein